MLTNAEKTKSMQNTTNSDDKLLNQISKIIEKNRYVAKAIQNAALKWGDIENPKETEMQVIEKIFEFFQQEPKSKEKCSAENISALANIIENKGLNIPVTDKCFSSTQIQLSSIAIKNEQKANKTKGFFARLGKGLGNLLTNSVDLIANSVGVASKSMKGVQKGARQFMEKTVKAGGNVVEGGGKFAKSSLKGAGAAIKGAGRGAGALTEGLGKSGALLSYGAAMGAGRTMDGVGKLVQGIGEGGGRIAIGVGHLVEGAGKGGGDALHGVGSFVKNSSEGLGTFAKSGLEVGAKITTSAGNLASEAIDTATTGVAIVHNGVKALESTTRYGANKLEEKLNGGKLNIDNLHNGGEESRADFKKRMMTGLTEKSPIRSTSTSHFELPEISNLKPKNFNKPNIPKTVSFGKGSRTFD